MEMKIKYFPIIICLLMGCNNRVKNNETTNNDISKDSTTEYLNMKLNDFDSTYELFFKQLQDSVLANEPDGIDFSDYTSGIKMKYDVCKDDFTKTLIGYKLAVNYYMQYESSHVDDYRNMAEPLFYSFLCYKNGEVASSFLKIDIAKVRYIVKKWNSFSEPDKKTILFYGLLRGFDNGLPEILKNID